MTPLEIKEKFDQYIEGQEEAKKTLSLICASLLRRREGAHIPKQNVLLIGDSGTGKSYLIHVMSRLFDIPMAVSDATRLTGAGYNGEDTDEVLERLIIDARTKSRPRGDLDYLKAAENGMVFIDEFDKIAGKRFLERSDEMVQAELLKMTEGAEIDLNNHGIPAITRAKPVLDTRNITFVFAGAFMGLHRKNNVLFSPFNSDYSIVNSELREALIEYGFTHELVGRITDIVRMEPMSTDLLVKIMKESKESVLKEYEEMFREDGKKLIIEDGAYNVIAQKAIKDGSGARAIKNILSQIFKDAMFRSLGDPTVKAVRITAESAEKGMAEIGT